jgi:CBS domain-containing protein
MLLEQGVALDDIVSFLERVPPFQFLAEEELLGIAKRVSVRCYAKGTMILTQGSAASDHLQIIRQGSVKVYMRSAEGEEVVIDYRGEGDLIGYLSLFSDTSRANVRAEEDTTCYLVSRETIRGILDTNPAFGEFFLKSYLNIYINRTFQEMHSKSLLIGSGDRVLFTTPVGELASKEIVTALQELSIKDAAKLMTHERISCLVVLDSANRPSGILTDSDLREKVVAKGRSVGEPVKNIMSLPLIRVEDKDCCFDAMMKMVKYNVHHLLVVRGGDVKGVITHHDLLLLQGTSPLSLAKDIESQVSVDGLVPVTHKVRDMVGVLLREGAKAGNITKIITEIHDRLVKRILELAEKRFGPPPVPYCWIALGSEGRKEQTFATDQDNAIIFADTETPSEADEVRTYFGPFTGFVKESLILCGFPPCPYDIMASNPKWCQPLGVWKDYFSRWVTAPLSEPDLNSVIFFDFRPMHGEAGLAQRLREFVASLVKEHHAFLGLLSHMAAKSKPPIGILKTFVVEKSGEHKDMLNLKDKGITPLVDMIRLFALEEGVCETSTMERIDALRDRHAVVRQYADDLMHVFEFVMHLRVQHHYTQAKAGRIPNDFINPSSLVKLERNTLKEVFHFIAMIEDIVTDRYKHWLW